MESRDGRLEVGDELVNVNGANMRGLTTDQVRPFLSLICLNLICTAHQAKAVMGSAGQLLELIVSREGKQVEQEEVEEAAEVEEDEERWGRRKMGRRGRPARGKEDDAEEQEVGEMGVFGSMGFLPCKESMGGTLPRGNQKGRSAQANEKLCSIQNNEKSCSAQKNVATERTILESGGHQVPHFFFQTSLSTPFET